MAPPLTFDHSVRVRQEIAEPEIDWSSSENGPELHESGHKSGGEGSSDTGQDGASEDSDLEHLKSSSDASESGDAPLRDISFGALAKAQDSLAPNPRKRKHTESSDALGNGSSVKSSLDPAQNYNEGFSRDSKRPKPSRSSKHAPTIQSSRYAVSRRREIFEPSPSLKSRDPRFDPTVLSSSSNWTTASEKANKNYSFLTSYQVTEILDLKSQIKKARDPETTALLKRQLMSLESKVRLSEARQREKDIMQQHRQEEREMIASGQKQKPYYMKKSEVRKKALTEKFESMGKKARDKAMERKRKRIKGKEGRSMPRARRDQNAATG